MSKRRKRKKKAGAANSSPAAGGGPSPSRPPPGAPRKWPALAAVVVLAAVTGFVASRYVIPPRAPEERVVKKETAAPEPKKLTAEELDRALRNEQLEVALALARAFPKSDDALYLAGIIHNEQGNAAEALKYWEKTVALDPNRADVYENIGHAALIREDTDTAEASFRKAIALDPTRQQAYLELAEALTGQGKMREVVTLLEKSPLNSPRMFCTLGQAYQRLGENAKAKEKYEAALTLKPDFAEACYGLFAVCARLGETEEAKEYRTRFNKLKAEGQKVGRRIRSAWDPLAITRQNVARTHTDVARVLRANGDREGAEKLWRRAAALDPKNAACRALLGGLYVRGKENGKALAMFEQALAIEPDNWELHQNAGMLYVRLNRFDEAEEAFKKVTSLAPRRSEGFFALARLYILADRHLNQAVPLARTAVELAPVPPNYAILSQALKKTGDRAGALRAIERAVRLAPRDARYRQLREQLQKGR